MKYSQFNAVIPFQERFALFNSFTQKVIFIEELLKELLETSQEQGCNYLQAVHPTFYDYLVAEEFFVPKTTDEIAKVKQVVKSVDENTDGFLLTINPTMNCNFKCWYCYETHLPTSRLSDDTIQHIQRFIDFKFQNSQLNYFNLSFFGGEPLLYFKKNVIPIVDFYLANCRNKNITPQIGFTTNGYLIDSSFIDYFKHNDTRCTLQITLDGHRIQHDQVRYVSKNKGSYDKIVQNIKLLVQNGFFVNLRVNYTTENIENAYLIADDFSDLPQQVKEDLLHFDFHRVWQDSKQDNTDQTAQQVISSVANKGFTCSSNYLIDNVRQSCYADKRNSAVFNYNGDVFKCTARDFTTESREGYLSSTGEIIWENNSLEYRMNAKFKNKPCLSCKIMPLCNGGCSQHAVDNARSNEDYCVFYGDESEKDTIILHKVKQIVQENNLFNLAS